MWLDGYRRMPTPDRYPGSHRLVEPLECVVVHYTASRPGKVEAVRRWLTRKDAHYVSAHFTISRSGDVMQHAELVERTWHAGGRTSRFRGRRNVNGRSLGIELTNAGPLSQDDSGDLRDAEGRPLYEQVPTIEVRGQLWEAYPEQQIGALLVLLEDIHDALMMAEPLPLIGHDEVDPLRKQDPGPAFPWRRFRRYDAWTNDPVVLAYRERLHGQG